MQQKIIVIISSLAGVPTVSEFKTKDAAKEQVKKLIQKGISPNIIRITQEIPMNIEIQVDVEFEE
ncbi:hypothetical protein [Bacillus cereus group sp. RP43]|uniref:hypothetical protein n=1 Tax=Bacillus cereus group sp. RP43 TaxID=3040260 RepID=UPI003392C903